jgi:hypothetical protein
LEVYLDGWNWELVTGKKGLECEELRFKFCVVES